MQTISLKPSTNATYRAITRLLTMIHELHKAGYQRIRFRSGMAPSGLHWRCLITHADAMLADGMALADGHRPDEVAYYSTGSQDGYFGWTDVPGRSARELGVMFLDRFPMIAAKGQGRDWAYAGWLTEILGCAERDEKRGFPVWFADYPIEIVKADRPPPIISSIA
ncbi:hypothetical protein [Sphingomonas prati]|uniref:Uncharacterized protein n=1 Tax=Sphingomonas prati TaxID=1843237 RepID=A0A7W9F1M2_9SPHN|nr:hypothetical protein [Sphingomonas prati]MBB5727909.1 hypothetical protein [Sphingomonas prati]GGE81801.1 hypothetical protein GCM10011404_13020 [Sphingomonas prati]